MRKIVYCAVGIAGLIIVTAVVLAVTFDVNRYRSTIQSTLQERLGRTVTLGEMRLSFFPPRFRVRNISIGDDRRFSTGQPFVEAQELDVSVKLLPLLRKSVQIDSLELKRPSVELIRNRQGGWNFASLGEKPEATKSAHGEAPSKAANQEPQSSTPPAPKPEPAQDQFALARLKISDGQIAVTDLRGKNPRAVYDHIDVTLWNFASGEPFSVAAAAHLPGPGNQEALLEGKGGGRSYRTNLLLRRFMAL